MQILFQNPARSGIPQDLEAEVLSTELCITLQRILGDFPPRQLSGRSAHGNRDNACLGYGNSVAWLYPLYYVLLLSTRERDDDKRCRTSTAICGTNTANASRPESFRGLLEPRLFKYFET